MSDMPLILGIVKKLLWIVCVFPPTQRILEVWRIRRISFKALNIRIPPSLPKFEYFDVFDEFPKKYSGHFPLFFLELFQYHKTELHF